MNIYEQSKSTTAQYCCMISYTVYIVIHPYSHCCKQPCVIIEKEMDWYTFRFCFTMLLNSNCLSNKFAMLVFKETILKYLQVHYLAFLFDLV